MCAPAPLGAHYGLVGELSTNAPSGPTDYMLPDVFYL